MTFSLGYSLLSRYLAFRPRPDASLENTNIGIGAAHARA